MIAGEADGVGGVAALEVLLGGSVGEEVTVGENSTGAPGKERKRW